MVPHWLQNVMLTLPGKPSQHCNALMVCTFALMIVSGLALPSVIMSHVLNFLACAMIIYFTIILAMKIAFKEIVDTRDYLVIRSVMVGVFFGMIVESCSRIIQHYAYGTSLKTGTWVLAILSLLIMPRTFRMYKAVVRLSSELKDWRTLSTTFRSRAED